MQYARGTNTTVNGKKDKKRADSKTPGEAGQNEQNNSQIVRIIQAVQGAGPNEKQKRGGVKKL